VTVASGRIAWAADVKAVKTALRAVLGWLEVHTST
jgi:hypothetical protein